MDGRDQSLTVRTSQGQWKHWGPDGRPCGPNQRVEAALFDAVLATLPRPDTAQLPTARELEALNQQRSAELNRPRSSCKPLHQAMLQFQESKETGPVGTVGPLGPIDTGYSDTQSQVLPIDFSGAEPHTNARDLHANLGNQRQFSDWFKQRVSECDLVKDQDFGIIHKFVKNSSRGRPSEDYWLTLDAAKEIAMLERNAAGKKIRRYLIEVEKRFRQQQQPAQPVLSMEELCRAFLEQGEQLKLTNRELEQAHQQVEVKVAELSEAEQKVAALARQQAREENAIPLSVWMHQHRLLTGHDTKTGLMVCRCVGALGRQYVKGCQHTREPSIRSDCPGVPRDPR